MTIAAPYFAGHVAVGTIGSMGDAVGLGGCGDAGADGTAMAQETDADDGGSEIVVTGHRPLRIDVRILRAAQARFAEDRAELSPQGVLRFELWREGKRVRAGGLPLSLTDGAGQQLPVTVDGDGRIGWAT